MGFFKDITTSIAVGATTTDAIKLNEVNNPVGITSGSGISASALTFLVSNDNITYTPLYDKSSTEVALFSGSVARSWALDIPNFYPWLFMKIREGTSTSAISQKTVDVNFTVSTRNIKY
jgi:hypothetical protein